MNLKETYNKIAKEWHNDHQTDDWWVSGTDKFIELIKPRGLVLDVGCGGGTKSKYLISRGLKVVGIDISENMINIAKTEVPEGKFIVMDLTEVGDLEDMFDGIFMQAVLLHIPKKDVPNILKSVISKLKSGGYLYIAVKEKMPSGVEEEIKIENDYGYDYERFFSYFTVEELEKYFKDLKLEIVFVKNSPSKNGDRAWIKIIGKKV